MNDRDMERTSSGSSNLNSRTLYLIRRSLLRWYRVNKRALPWRVNRDPYRIWLSEIMLQQTRVAAVVSYYENFLKRFPTIEALAAARESSVVAAWSGLGYYRRARALHQAARTIVGDYQGRFPRRAEDLRELPGIGRYTSAAIASIAFNQRAAVVDGNVKRVLSRVLGKTLVGEAVWESATVFLSRRRPGDFNQAIMELGAMVCLPREPKCSICPVFAMCATRGELAKARPAVRRRREIHYALNLREGQVFMVQRPEDSSLMPGMWELPELSEPNRVKPILSLKHSITVTDYWVRVLPASDCEAIHGRWVRKIRLPKLPLTGLTRKILRATHII